MPGWLELRRRRATTPQMATPGQPSRLPSTTKHLVDSSTSTELNAPSSPNHPLSLLTFCTRSYFFCSGFGRWPQLYGEPRPPKPFEYRVCQQLIRLGQRATNRQTSVELLNARYPNPSQRWSTDRRRYSRLIDWAASSLFRPE